MKLEAYPRPHDDTGIGFVYFADAEHYDRDDLSRWLPRLQELGASWLVLQTPPSRPVPDAFLQRLMMANIEPVVVLRPGHIGPLDKRELAGTANALASSGVHYVALYDRPNVRENWLPKEWSKPSLVERFVDYLAPAMEQVARAGLVPVLPPLEPFGAYWDTVFLKAMLSSLKRRGLGELVSRSAAGMRNFGNNRPLEWGQGGRGRWPDARPYQELTEGEDHRGFRQFEWYQEIIQDVMGGPLPLLACANGPQASQPGCGSPEISATVEAERAFAMGQAMLGGELPDWVMNLAFWVLSAERHRPEYGERWYDPDGRVNRPAVNALERLPRQARSAGAAAPEAAAESAVPTIKRIAAQVMQRPRVKQAVEQAAGKPIQHYLLLPVFEWGVSSWHLEVIKEYVEAFHPTCGFSAEEAKLAERVTVVGNEQGINERMVEELKSAGCQVERVAGKNGRETQQILQQLARNKQPFLTR